MVEEQIYPDQESARKAGAMKFWGKRCVKHPGSTRYTSSGRCIRCAIEAVVASNQRKKAGLSRRALLAKQAETVALSKGTNPQAAKLIALAAQLLRLADEAA